MVNITESLDHAAAVLDSAGIDDPRREAVSLLSFALGKDRAFLIAHPEYSLDGGEAELFDQIIKRRASREPFHHIVGVKEFYGLDFKISADVLIPRPETEMLAARSIEILAGKDGPTFCEVGVGSGCIAISVLHNLGAARAVGLEKSSSSLAIARLNAERHGVTERFRLVPSDVFSAIDNERFDLIVSNPPYIPAKDVAGLQPEVREYEPHSALTDGADGLSIIEELVNRSPAFLKPGGHLVLEIGVNQAEAVKAMFGVLDWENVEFVSDFQGIPRMAVARLAIE
jgi:release factor glutamine methyltransferase